MSDNGDSDYYSNSDSNSDDSDNENVKTTVKKPIIVNAAKKFGNYIEDESEPDDSEPDDAEPDDVEDEDEDEQDGGADDDLDDVEVKEDEEPDDAIPDEEDDEDSDIEIGEDGEAVEKNPIVNKTKKTTQLIIADEDDEDDDDDYDENYLQKFEHDITKNYINEFHPECLNHNSDEVSKLASVIRDENGTIIDALHRTIPYLTKYERARVLGQRAKQIEYGAKPLVKVPENIIDGYIIAELELKEKKIPFIIKRPIPGGAFEYWHLRDLEMVQF